MRRTSKQHWALWAIVLSCSCVSSNVEVQKSSTDVTSSTGGQTSNGNATTDSNSVSLNQNFIFSPYKDITINIDWNTDIISTLVTGSRASVITAVPDIDTLTWSFATGECGAESWGGITGNALAAANISTWVNAKKSYIISTGGAAGAFTCETDTGFTAFLERYYSEYLRGIDFDIEAGQSQAAIESLVQRVANAQETSKYAKLRFSFTLATLGGETKPSLASVGTTVIQAIKKFGLKNYTINLMVMDYGAANANNCVLDANNQCDMGQSAIRAAMNLQESYQIPLTQIELTPMIGGNDTQGEFFTLSNVDTVVNFVRTNQLAGLHYWSLDRDTDCAIGYASPTCNSFGEASSGALGFFRRFAQDLK